MSSVAKRRKVDAAIIVNNGKAAVHCGSVLHTLGSFRIPIQQQQQAHYSMMSRNTPHAYPQQPPVQQY